MYQGISLTIDFIMLTSNRDTLSFVLFVRFTIDQFYCWPGT
jgi:hypothetical protein